MDAQNKTPLSVEDWAVIVIQQWVQMSKTLGISPDHPFTDERFKMFLTTQANGDVSKITFTFDFYLKFVNWGVGKGVPISNRDTLIAAGLTKRRKKPWFDEVFPKQLTILGYLLAERYGQRTIALVKTELGTFDTSGNQVKSKNRSDTRLDYDKVHGN